MADKDLNTVSESLAFDANDFAIASIGGALKKVKKSLIYTKPVPSTGNTLTGALDLTNTEGTYYDAKTVTGALTFSISGSTESGWARGRLVCDGTNPFASNGNFTTIFEERITGGIVGGLPVDYILPIGTYSFYAWATDSGYSISINGPITDAVAPDVTAPATMVITNVTITGTDGDFTASLNGGDAVTADNDLIFKIYGSADGYTTPIKTTGSHTTDADVTVTGDSVTINNVNVGAETLFKITALDAASNESVKSDAYDASILNYTFDGTTINTEEWTVTNPNPTLISISQNNKIIIKRIITGISDSRSNYILSSRVFSSGTFEFDFFISTGATTSLSVYLVNSDITRFGGIVSPSSSPYRMIRAFVKDVDHTNSDFITSESYESSSIRFKLIYNGTTLDFYYDKGAGYIHIGEYDAVLGNVSLMVAGTNGDADSELTFDNLTISDFISI